MIAARGLARPRITGARQSASTWREGASLAKISATRRSRRKPPVGTTFTFTLNEQARVTLDFTHAVQGRRVGRKCLAKTRANARRKSCKRTVSAGALSFSARLGASKVRFQGRISRSKRLSPGRYTVVITAVNAAGARSAPVSLTFTIVK